MHQNRLCLILVNGKLIRQVEVLFNRNFKHDECMSTLKTEKYMLPFDPESLASGLLYKKHVDLNIQNYHFPHSFFGGGGLEAWLLTLWQEH
jgi:hypothetical protein